MAKQNITFLKIQKFIRKYPIILFYQHNNLSVKQWFSTRSSIKNIKNCDVLLLKNTLMQNVLLQENLLENQNFQALFQGPCFAVGFSDFSDFETLGKISEQNSSIFLIGGLIENQFINHLDILKMKTLNNDVYISFLNNLQQDSQVIDKLSYSGKSLYNNLTLIPSNLIHCLELLKQNH